MYMYGREEGQERRGHGRRVERRRRGRGDEKEREGSEKGEDDEGNGMPEKKSKRKERGTVFYMYIHSLQVYTAYVYNET